MSETSTTTPAPVSETVYVEIVQPTGDARFGKLAAGRIVPVPAATATRWIGAGVATESDQAAYDAYKAEQTEMGDRRRAALDKMNGKDSAMWDSNYRDAVLADPDKLQEAIEAGVPITNLGMLYDEAGLPLTTDATHEDIMDARENIQHPDAGIDAHTSSSTSGNRSHYTEPIPERQRPPEPAMTTEAPPLRARRVGRVQRHATTGDSAGNVTPTESSPPPPPPTDA